MTATETAPGRMRLLTAAEVCERLGIKRTKLWTLRQDPGAGFPKAAKLGGNSQQHHLRWREDEIDAWFEATRSGSP